MLLSRPRSIEHNYMQLKLESESLLRHAQAALACCHVHSTLLSPQAFPIM
jgi:hypothetical protein